MKKDYVYSVNYYCSWCYLGADFFTYQVACGLSLRWFEGFPHFRLYVGPFKLFGGLRKDHIEYNPKIWQRRVD